MAYVPKELAGANITANLLRISPDRSLMQPSWFKHSLLNERFKSRLQSIVTRTTIDTVTAADVSALRVCLPDSVEQGVIASMLDTADEAVVKGKKHMDALLSLKASAVDALLTGRVRVPAGRDSEDA